MLRRLREIDPALPPDAGATSEARILDYGERDMVRPGGKPIRRRSVSPDTKRYLVLAAAVVLTGASVWAWSQPKTSAAARLGPELAASSATTPATTAATTPATVAASETAIAPSAQASTPLPAAPTSASPSPRAPLAGIYVTGGWVRRVEVPLGTAPEVGVVGPGGTIFIGGAISLDRDGHDDYATPGRSVPHVFDAEGTAYGVQYGQESASIWAVRPDGGLAFSYTLAVQTHVDLLLSEGSLLALYPVMADGGESTEILQLDPYGTALSVWRMPGLVRLAQGEPQLAVRPGGNLLAQVVRGDSCAIEVFTPAGQRVSHTSGCWQSLVNGVDGTLVGWSCQAVEQGRCARSTIAVLKDDGTATKGWPKTYETTTSIPAVGPQGIYYVVSPSSGAAAAVLGVRRDGRQLTGWPVVIDSDPGAREFDVCQCSIPPTPAVGSGSGIVMLQTEYDLRAWDSRGRQLETGAAGNATGAAFAMPIYSETGSKAILFAAAVDRIQAIDPVDGKPLVAMFVDRGENKVAWLGWQRMPDGGIVVFAYHASDRESYVVVARLDLPA